MQAKPKGKLLKITNKSNYINSMKRDRVDKNDNSNFLMATSLK